MDDLRLDLAHKFLCEFSSCVSCEDQPLLNGERIGVNSDYDALPDSAFSVHSFTHLKYVPGFFGNLLEHAVPENRNRCSR